MKRREFLQRALLAPGVAAIALPARVATQNETPRIAFTFDDFNVFDVPALSGPSRNRALLDALRANGLKAAGFVIGRYVEDPDKMRLLQQWSDAGHIVGNHTYSHRRYSRAGFSEFTKDILENEAKLKSLPQFRKWLRFPFLDEGVTADQRDRIRGFLADSGYRNAHITIDASDWYVDGRLRARLEKDRDADVAPYRAFYLDHIWDRAMYYETLSRQVIGRRIHHTLLLHHNVLNGMFLGDLLRMFRDKGWQLVDAETAYADPVFASTPRVLPAGQSLVWSLAKATGRFDTELRYPGEDGAYEAPKMDALGL